MHMHESRIQPAALLARGVILLGMLGFVVFSVVSTHEALSTTGKLSKGEGESVALSAIESPDRQMRQAGDPVQIRIPVIGVDADIQAVQESRDGSMGIPTNYDDVGWYRPGPRPGEPGTVVLNGHLDGKDTPRAVFSDLHKLAPGDRIDVLDESGLVHHYRVTGKKVYDYEADTAEVFAEGRRSRLNLITCGGEWIDGERTYDKRVVIFTELVS